MNLQPTTKKGRDVMDQMAEYVSYYRKARGHDPERIVLNKQQSEAVKWKDGATYYGIPVVTDGCASRQIL